MIQQTTKPLGVIDVTQSDNSQSRPCPCCGYCPTCGRASAPFRYYDPWPWWPNTTTVLPIGNTPSVVIW